MAYNPGLTDVTAAISISANATSSGLCQSLGGGSTYTIQLSGTWTGTLQIQVTRDGTNWVNVTGSSLITNLTTGAYVSSGNIAANGIYQLDVTGCHSARVITTAYTLGPITGSACLTQSDAAVSIDGIPTVTVSGMTPSSPTAYTAATTASTNAASIKTAAGNFYALALSNPTATPAFVKFYNKASAPTVGTDVPVITVPVAANSVVAYEFAPLGLRFGTGIAIACTGGIAATDTANAVAGVQIMLSYV